MKVSKPALQDSRESLVRFWGPLAALTVVAGCLRSWHFEKMWSYWTLDYLSYYEPIREDLSTTLPWNRLVGLHPPQHGMVVSSLFDAGFSVHALVQLSIFLSLLALVLAALTLRELGSPTAGLITAGLLAASPYQVHYGIELNNYPLFLAGGSALVWTATRIEIRARQLTPRPTSLSDALLLTLASSVTLHGHLLGLPAVAAVLSLFAWRRNSRATAAVVVAVLSFVPVGASFLDMLDAQTTFHNGRLSIRELLLTLQGAWLGRFGSGVSLGLAQAAVLLGLLFSFRKKTHRWVIASAGFFALALLLPTFAGFWSGAANVSQTPYWLLLSWLAWSIVGLGWMSASQRGRRVLSALLTLWLVVIAADGALLGHYDSRASLQAPQASEESAQALSQYLSATVSQGDAVVYLWEPAFLNDNPTSTDRLFASFPPTEVNVSTSDKTPCRNYLFSWKGSSLCVRASSGMRGDEHEEALAADLEFWLRGGRSVHLIQAHLDPARARPSSAGLKQRLLDQQFSWREGRPGGVRVIHLESPAGRL